MEGPTKLEEVIYVYFCINMKALGILFLYEKDFFLCRKINFKYGKYDEKNSKIRFHCSDNQNSWYYLIYKCTIKLGKDYFDRYICI